MNVPEAVARPFPFVQLCQRYCLPDPAGVGVVAETAWVEPAGQLNDFGSWA